MPAQINGEAESSLRGRFASFLPTVNVGFGQTKNACPLAKGDRTHAWKSCPRWRPNAPHGPCGPHCIHRLTSGPLTLLVLWRASGCPWKLQTGFACAWGCGSNETPKHRAPIPTIPTTDGPCALVAPKEPQTTPPRHQEGAAPLTRSLSPTRQTCKSRKRIDA